MSVKNWHDPKSLEGQLKASVKAVKSGKKPKLTRAILGRGITCEITADGEFVLPEDQGLCVDLLYRVRERRLEIEREAERVGKLETMLKEHFIETLSANSTGLAGRVALVKVEPKPVPQVADYELFYEFVRKNKAFELLQRRLNEAACKERMDGDPRFAGRAGITIFRAKKVSVTRL
jgi:hypothetical protein